MLMIVPDEGPKLGSAPPKPEGAQWAEPLEIIDKVTYRADGAGYLKPGFDQIFMVDADRRRAAPADLRRVSTTAARSNGPRTAARSCSAPTAQADWERDAARQPKSIGSTSTAARHAR